MNKTIDEIDFEKSGGLVPVIVQDANTKEVLTLAYSNKESLELAKKTGKSWFYSRSRNKLWMKGEESGNIQEIKEILVDCDSDAIIYLVEPSGPACHTGERVCFHHSLEK
ncbi:phosphoribosyl-AMP cyclohydrolase [Candidatus Nitrosopumilus sp. SW]|uniref:phosphoribosyl-AMP cyclohydrolase n=1 Tax=Candidatus Nitrosopumilus sp. SW TaxID=2508726 RepID=UPI001153EBE6|nr:phosphoribosyl-AMP cyclohydrolase [Candidatus Nitrosopumilus sp. SW]QDI89135.1 phosphoribosyl-AMP cyclohydrolase [Candidatus Nitrosopumilus sp. SW]